MHLFCERTAWLAPDWYHRSNLELYHILRRLSWQNRIALGIRRRGLGQTYQPPYYNSLGWVAHFFLLLNKNTHEIRIHA